MTEKAGFFNQQAINDSASFLSALGVVKGVFKVLINISTLELLHTTIEQRRKRFFTVWGNLYSSSLLDGLFPEAH